MTTPPLQTAPAPGELLVLLSFLGVLVSVVLSAVILAKAVQSYRGTGDPALLGLASGILLLSGVPLLANVALASATATDPATVSVLVDLTQLSGLGLILYVIYHTGQ